MQIFVVETYNDLCFRSYNSKHRAERSRNRENRLSSGQLIKQPKGKEKNSRDKPAQQKKEREGQKRGVSAKAFG